ncbi:hypothetical protein B0T14DRAFT_339132 [Immersiella caudata]|uniref:Uncharacterized protein n=1 Tax=Immersiella caudata TaxID=314043 RepID=A0AA39U3Z9_9PEZI|nr:hypothetical protein B0T14DRAFT_339132 [Immersiella caudata]
MEFAMDLDMNPRKRFLEEDLALDGALHLAKKTRQDADAFALESQPSTPSEAPSTPALTNEDSEMQESGRSPSPAPSTPGSLNQARRYQRYLRQGYPMSWLINNLN